MLKQIEATGKNEEAAIASALAQLGLDRDEVSVEILDRAKSGCFGLGSSPARVRITYEVPDLPEDHKAPNPEPVEPEEPAEKAVFAQQEPQAPAAGEVPCDGEDDRSQRIQEFLTGLMAHMQVNASAQIEKSPDGGYPVTMVGEELGALIGRRGETLDAIQQLTNYVVNKGQAKRVRIHIDAEHYRAKREESLQRLAQKVAGKVVKYRRNVTLEPMNAYERHVIHAALQDYPGVTTYSTGTEPNRRTVVAYEPAGKR